MVGVPRDRPEASGTCQPPAAWIPSRVDLSHREDGSMTTIRRDGVHWTGPSVSICVITYKRPEGLRRLLTGINGQEFSGTPPGRVEVVVVDNDPEGSAAAICGELATASRWPIVYKVEPRRGIPFARNTALLSVSPESEFIAFLDDDEVPSPQWLEAILRVQAEFDADVVMGPVIPHYIEPPPQWIVEGRFFDGLHRPTGTRLQSAHTGNVIVRASVIRHLQIRFNEDMALTGGEDTHFFMQIVRAGYKIVFAEEAVVHEWLPPSRVNAVWILQRAYRLGTTLGLCERDLAGSARVLFVRLAKGIGRIVFGTLYVALVPWFSSRPIKAEVVRGMRSIMFGAGMVAGIMGWRYEEYRRVHGV